MKKTLIMLVAIVSVCLIAQTSVLAADSIAYYDFEDGNIGPFSVQDPGTFSIEVTSNGALEGTKSLLVTGNEWQWMSNLISVPSGLKFEPGKDYTVMFRYSAPTVPSMQITIRNLADKEAYCWRWDTDMDCLWSFQVNYETGDAPSFTGDFEFIQDTDSVIVSFHFYNRPDADDMFLRLQACDEQVEPWRIIIDQIRIFEGYQHLTLDALNGPASVVDDSPVVNDNPIIDTTVVNDTPVVNTTSSAAPKVGDSGMIFISMMIIFAGAIVLRKKLSIN